MRQLLHSASGKPFQVALVSLFAVLIAVPGAAQTENDPATEERSAPTDASREAPESSGERVVRRSLSEVTAEEIDEMLADDRRLEITTVGKLMLLRFPWTGTTSCSRIYVLDGRITTSTEALDRHPSEVALIRVIRQYDGQSALYGFRGNCGAVEIVTRRRASNSG